MTAVQIAQLLYGLTTVANNLALAHQKSLETGEDVTEDEIAAAFDVKDANVARLLAKLRA